MKRVFIAALMLGVICTATGCATNAIVANNTIRDGVFFGDLGISGDDNDVTAREGSRIRKVSINGHRNTVTVEDDVPVTHVEFVGTGNTVSVPASVIVRMTELGRENTIVRRAADEGTTVVEFDTTTGGTYEGSTWVSPPYTSQPNGSTSTTVYEVTPVETSSSGHTSDEPAVRFVPPPPARESETEWEPPADEPQKEEPQKDEPEK